jgi:predicted nucleic acid-binding protein
LIEIVLDASVAVPAVVGASAAGRAIRHRLVGTVCHAPHLIDAEIGAVLRRSVASGAVEARTAEAGLGGLSSVVDARHPHGRLAEVALGLRHNLTYDDLTYDDAL